MLNWISVYSQTEEICENYFYTSWLKDEKSKSFPNNIREVGGIIPPAGEWEILVKGETFSLGGENLSRSDFDYLDCFQC